MDELRHRRKVKTKFIARVGTLRSELTLFGGYQCGIRKNNKKYFSVGNDENLLKYHLSNHKIPLIIIIVVILRFLIVHFFTAHIVSASATWMSIRQYFSDQISERENNSTREEGKARFCLFKISIIFAMNRHRIFTPQVGNSVGGTGPIISDLSPLFKFLRFSATTPQRFFLQNLGNDSIFQITISLGRD